MMLDQSELHNKLAGQIVASIVRPPLEEGGSETDVLVLLESVITGVILYVTKFGGDEIIMDNLADGVKLRLATLRLTDRPTAGTS